MGNPIDHKDKGDKHALRTGVARKSASSVFSKKIKSRMQNELHFHDNRFLSNDLIDAEFPCHEPFDRSVSRELQKNMRKRFQQFPHRIDPKQVRCF